MHAALRRLDNFTPYYDPSTSWRSSTHSPKQWNLTVHNPSLSLPRPRPTLRYEFSHFQEVKIKKQNSQISISWKYFICHISMDSYTQILTWAQSLRSCQQFRVRISNFKPLTIQLQNITIRTWLLTSFCNIQAYHYFYRHSSKQ